MKYFVLGILLIFINCKHKESKLDFLYGESILSKFYYKKACLSCDNLHSIYIDKSSNWFTIEDQSKTEIAKGKFKLYYGENKEIYLDIFDCNNEKITGNYVVEVTLISSSLQTDILKIVIQSNYVYIETYKNIVKKIGK